MEASDNTDGVQLSTNRYFARHASDWADIYRSNGVKDVVHQQRLRSVLGLVEKLKLPAGTRALEVGCGAGYAAVTLAERGLDVDAIDPVPEMVNATRARALRQGVERGVRTSSGDVHSLPFGERTFDLVIAMGVLPWLPSIARPLSEMARVLREGGHLVVTTDNLWSPRWWVEPLSNPLVMPVKTTAQRFLKRLGREPSCAPWYPSTTGRIDRRLEELGLQKIAGLTAGFGPFTCFNRELIPGRWGVALHANLQRLADSGTPILQSLGCHYIVMARKARLA
jgi:SAM-dependent methyltransferase